MADRKISDLTALTTPATGDLIPIVDISEAAAADKNKSITVGELLRGAPDGTAAAPGFAFESDGGNGMFLDGTDILAFSTGGSQAVTIDASQRLGVGTSAPSSLLHLEGSDGVAQIRLQRSGTNIYGIIRQTSAPYGLTYDAVDVNAGAPTHTFRTSNDGSTFTDRMSLTSTGLGIGTAIPGRPLQVAMDSASATVASFVNDGAAVAQIGFQNTSLGNDATIRIGAEGTNFTVYTNNSRKLDVDSSGRLLVGTSSARANFFNSTITAMSQVEGTGAGTSSARAGIAVINNNAASDFDSSLLILARSYGSAVGDNNLVTSGGQLGHISFQGADNTDFVEGASIQAFVDGTSAANDMPGRLVFSTTANGASSPTEHLRIASNGAMEYKVAGGNIATTNGIIFGTGELFNGNSTASGAGASLILLRSQYSVANETKFEVTSEGNVKSRTNSYAGFSDETLKEQIEDASSQWNDIKEIKVRNFKFKSEKLADNKNPRLIGVIAQEIEQFSPGLVDKDAEGIKSVKYSVLYMKAVKALQEAMERIETLEAKVAALEAQ